MSVSAEYLDYIQELLAPLGAIRARRMFSGAGFYCEDLFFALVIDDVLYLKTDEHNRADFEQAGSEPFRYESDGKQVTMGYYRAPDEAMDSPALMLPWARGALAAALRAKSHASGGKRKKKAT